MSDDPYPFESDDDLEIRELDLISVDAFDDERITVGQLSGQDVTWRYGHVIVDEAQDLTPMQWRMVMRRVRGRSLTIVGDLAQRSSPDTGGWKELLPAELSTVQRQDLTVNYRSPVEIHELAVAVLAAYAPDVAPSTALRAVGVVPRFVEVESISDSLPEVITGLIGEVGGVIAVIGESEELDRVSAVVSDQEQMADERGRVRWLTTTEAKGLEFDAVIILEPAAIWNAGPARLYIALTRPTQRLVVLHSQPLPPVLAVR